MRTIKQLHSAWTARVIDTANYEQFYQRADDARCNTNPFGVRRRRVVQPAPSARAEAPSTESLSPYAYSFMASETIPSTSRNLAREIGRLRNKKTVTVLRRASQLSCSAPRNGQCAHLAHAAGVLDRFGVGPTALHTPIIPIVTR
jgi:hypothetical protein